MAVGLREKQGLGWSQLATPTHITYLGIVSASLTRKACDMDMGSVEGESLFEEHAVRLFEVNLEILFPNGIPAQHKRELTKEEIEAAAKALPQFFKYTPWGPEIKLLAATVNALRGMNKQERIGTACRLVSEFRLNDSQAAHLLGLMKK